MATRWLCSGAWAEALRRRTGPAGVAAAARGHLRPGVSDHEELFRDQGIQFFGSLCAVRRTSQRPHAESAAVRSAVVRLDTTAHGRCRSDAARTHAAWSL